MKRLPAVVLTCTLASVVLLICVRWFGYNAGAQRRRSARPSATQTRRNPAVDYSKFSHATKQHQGKCNSCHQAPTSNWKKVSEFPDVADYPDHESCVLCHRQQFFRSATPVICSVCHKKTSPRDEARLIFPYTNLSQEFKIIFPHDRHQDVIASLFRPRRNGGPNEPVYTKATLPAHAPDEKTKSYNNCSICHIPNTDTHSQPSGGWIDGYVPLKDTFMGAPEGHASCFSCHWARQEPVRNNCAGCHLLAGKPYFASSIPKRISIKFRHEGGGEKKNHIAECTTCHINITKVTTLEALKPDVPITSCSECHNKEGLRQDLSTELVAIDKNKTFTCSYCHTSNIGKLDPPPSHTIVAGRPQLKREGLK